jgi:hypothetical protein
MTPARPRVLHLVPALFGKDGVVGGAERYSFELARHGRRVPSGDGDRAEERAIGDLDVRVISRAWHAGPDES